MSTRMVTCKTVDDVPVSGVSFQVVDGNIEAVIVEDDSGNSIRIVKGSDYSSALKVLRDSPLIEVEKWYVTGKLLGLTDFEEEVGSEGEGDIRRREIMEQTNVWDKDKLGLTVVSRKVKIEDTKLG